MPTISGVWVWNDFLNLTEFFTSGTGESITNVNCTVNGKNYHTVVVDSYGNRMPNYITLTGDDTITICNSRDTNTSVPIFVEYKNIDFGDEEQEVSQEFYNGLVANATKQEEPVVPTTTKTVSSDNLARFKQKCDETYAKIGEGGGGTKKYLHNITVENGSFTASDIYFSMVTDDAEAYTDDGEIAKALYNLGFRYIQAALQATGVYDSLTTFVVAVSNGQSDSGIITFVLVDPSNSSALVQKSGSVNVVSDIVIEL